MLDAHKTVPVLIVDPDPHDRGLVRNQLAYGPMIGRFRVYEASSMTEALDCLLTHSVMFFDALARPGIIVTEVSLPEHPEAGWTLLQQIREDPLTSHLGTVCLTSQSDSTSKLRGIQYADDYVVKPTDPQEFPSRLLLLVRSKQVPSSLQSDLLNVQERVR
jgi:CheY-like chemotaxis protein